MAAKKKTVQKKKNVKKSKKKSAKKSVQQPTAKRSAPTRANRSIAKAALASDSQMRQAASESSLFERLRDGLKTVDIDGERLWIAEGDTLLDEDQLMVFAAQREQADAAAKAAGLADRAGLGTAFMGGRSAGLVANTSEGRVTRWDPGLVLTYRVVRNTFTSAARYKTAVDNMAAATEAWEKTCGVKFQHLKDLDEKVGTGPGGALFAVRLLNTFGRFLASAFFPNDPVNRRRVLIDPTYFSSNFDPVGILRHELGHVLGFRHEHIRSGAPAACPDEPLFDTKNLTDYDPQSVMHYFCGDVGSSDLRITDVDREGAQMVYGPPLAAVEYIKR